MANPRSTASIAGHPIHPNYVPGRLFYCDLRLRPRLLANRELKLGDGGDMAARRRHRDGAARGDRRFDRRPRRCANPRVERCVVARRRQRRRRVDPALQLVRPVHGRNGGGCAQRSRPVVDRGLSPRIYGLEGLGHGLSRSRRRGRCDRDAAPPERIAAARGIMRRARLPPRPSYFTLL